MARVYIGNLGLDCREHDVEKLFRDYGRITDIHLKGVYGFLNFDDKRDASDAIKEVNGRSFNGGRIRVDYAKEPRGAGGRDRFDRGGPRRSFDRPRARPGKWTNYRLLVENLSSKTSWQDLKDYMREAGDITYTKAHSPRTGDGVVEFADRKGMEYALRKLDDTELDGRRIKLIEEGGGSRRDRSRSRSRGRRSRSRDRSNSRSKSRSRSRSRSRSPEKKRERSDSRSRSRSNTEKKRARSGSRSRSRSNAEKRPRSSSKDDRERSKSASKEERERERSRSGSKERRSKSGSKDRDERPRSLSKERRERSSSRSSRGSDNE